MFISENTHNQSTDFQSNWNSSNLNVDYFQQRIIPTLVSQLNIFGSLVFAYGTME